MVRVAGAEAAEARERGGEAVCSLAGDPAWYGYACTHATYRYGIYLCIMIPGPASVQQSGPVTITVAITTPI